MKHKPATLLFFIVLFSCTTTTEESSTPINSGIHFSTKQDVRPMSLVSSPGSHDLYYAAKDAWYTVASTDLINWDEPRPLSIPGNAVGEIIRDELNNSQLGSTEKPPLLAIYNTDEIGLTYSLDNGSTWQDGNIELPEGTIGNPKIMQDGRRGRWLMAVTDQQNVTILTSDNLLSWSETAKLSLASNARTATLQEIDNRWFLILSGDGISYLEVDARFEKVSEVTQLFAAPEPLWTAFSSSEEIPRMLTNVGNKILSVPYVLAIGEERLLTAGKLDALDQYSETKRRSKLSSLRGQGTSRFQVNADEAFESAQIIIYNEQGETLKVGITAEQVVVDQTGASNSHPGVVTTYELSSPTNSLSADILIDFSSIELRIGERVHLMIPTQPVFIYDQISVQIDGKEIDARGVLYTLKQKAADSAPSI